MPVIRSPEDEVTWLNPEASPAQVLACLQPFPAHLLRITPVSPKVNSPTYNAPGLLQRVTHDGPGGALHERETAAEAEPLFPDFAPVSHRRHCRVAGRVLRHTAPAHATATWACACPLTSTPERPLHAVGAQGARPSGYRHAQAPQAPRGQAGWRRPAATPPAGEARTALLAAPRPQPPGCGAVAQQPPLRERSRVTTRGHR